MKNRGSIPSPARTSPACCFIVFFTQRTGRVLRITAFATAVDVSPDLISSVTDAVLGEVAAWQARPPDPATTLQTCIVRLMRNSLDYASWKDRKPLAAAIKPVNTAPSAEAAKALSTDWTSASVCTRDHVSETS